MSFRTLAAAAIAVALAGPAAAATMQAVFIGTVQSGTDASGTFGTGGSDLTGLAYRLTYTWDTGAGTFDQSHLPAYEELTGGFTYGTAPAVSASFLLNGVTFAFDATFAGRVVHCAAAACPASGLATYVAEEQTYIIAAGLHVANTATTTLNYTQSFQQILSGLVPADLTQPFALTLDAPDFPSVRDYVSFSLYDENTGLYPVNVLAYLRGTSLTVSQVAAVPVPASGRS